MLKHFILFVGTLLLLSLIALLAVILSPGQRPASDDTQAVEELKSYVNTLSNSEATLRLLLQDLHLGNVAWGLLVQEKTKSIKSMHFALGRFNPTQKTTGTAFALYAATDDCNSGADEINTGLSTVNGTHLTAGLTLLQSCDIKVAAASKELK